MSQEDVVRGREAKTIIESEVFKTAYLEMREALLREWVDTNPKETEKREDLYRLVRLLPEFHKQLTIIIEKGQMENLKSGGKQNLTRCC